MQTPYTIAILGTGAVGAYYGGRLAQHGHDVHFYARSDAAAIRQRGLIVESFRGDFTIPADRVHVYDDVTKMPRADLVIVTLKATAKPQYRELITPLLHDRTRVLCLQNGFGNEEAFAEVVGRERVMGAIAFVCINRVGPGHAKHTSHGLVKLGEFAGPLTDDSRRLVQWMVDSNIEAQAVDDLRRIRWEKLVWNIPFNGFGAALDLHTAGLLRSADGVSLVRATMHEVVKAGRAVGVDLRDDVIERLIETTYAAGDYHTSMQLDRQSGRAMEVDAILAEPIRQAEAAGCRDLPRMKALLEALRVVDGATTPSREGTK
ncbi:MAG: 2-dehydropantoate 2-reductase [Tepidisphaeraceae bacterium]